MAFDLSDLTFPNFPGQTGNDFDSTIQAARVCFKYETTDTLATVAGANYFPAKIFRNNDFIAVVGDDGNAFYRTSGSISGNPTLHKIADVSSFNFQ